MIHPTKLQYPPTSLLPDLSEKHQKKPHYPSLFNKSGNCRNAANSR